MLFVAMLALFSVPCFGQGGDSPYPDVDENKLIETKWRYTYALHTESNTIIHKADENYDFYIHFKYDYSYEQYLNSRMTRGNWSLNGSELFYNFKHIKKFFIAEASGKSLVLEFTQPNSKGSYQYHYVRVNSSDAPFVKPANELPDIDVEAEDPNAVVAKKARRRKKKNRRKRYEEPKEQPVYISIELVGGGFYGGIDPVLRDYIQIKSSGRLIKEFQSTERGLVVTKKDIPREELEAFAEYCIAKNFFDMERIYDCEDAFCQDRKRKKPTPIPLRLMIAYGTKKKVVTITMYGRDDANVNYVPYPKELGDIITSIQKMADKL